MAAPTTIQELTSWVIHGWLWVETAALRRLGHRMGTVNTPPKSRNETDSTREPLTQRLDESSNNSDSDASPLSPIDTNSNPVASNPLPSTHPGHLGVCQYLQNTVIAIFLAILIGCYAFVHVHVIQTEDRVFITTWFYEWFIIPVLLSFSFCAPLHQALGYRLNLRMPTNVSTGSRGTRRTNSLSSRDTNWELNGNYEEYGDTDDDDDQNEKEAEMNGNLQTSTNHQKQLYRQQQLEKDPATQRLVIAVVICYVVYIVGDAAFFIPLSPRHTHFTTYLVYLLAVLTNMAFIYQGFFLAILTMRAMVVRLHDLETRVDAVLKEKTKSTTIAATSGPEDTAAALRSHTDVPREQLLEWVQHFQELRDDMQILSNHFGVRLAVGITMFVVEASNMILNVWEAIGSTLTRQQTILLLLMYAANAAMLIMVTFQAAYTVTLCTERIGPSIALLSLRTAHSPDRAAELNVLAQTCMQAPIRLRAGNFHITADYANALTAWFFGLFLLVFGMKLPKI